VTPKLAEMTPGVLKEIWIYPIKSLGGIALQTASVRRKGLRFDRRWMLIDNNGIAMTQRIYPAMALFKVRIERESIAIDFKKDDKVLSSISFPLIKTVPQSVSAQVWGDRVEVNEVDHTVSEWFSDLLKNTCRLVAFPEDNPRPVDEKYRVADDHVSLADAYPFLIIGQASLDDLNQKLEQAVPMNRFRPNFVFTGGTPYIEDTWRDLTIGEVPFVAVKKSDRCILITVNQETGERGAEPLRTLSTYRKESNKVFFGQNLIAIKEGQVSVGDLIIASKT